MWFPLFCCEGAPLGFYSIFMELWIGRLNVPIYRTVVVGIEPRRAVALRIAFYKPSGALAARLKRALGTLARPSDLVMIDEITKVMRLDDVS
jgi:hypothetical protein